MPDVPRENELALAGECTHSKSLPYGAAVMMLAYWGAKIPEIHAAVPYVAEMANAAAASFTGLLGWQSARQAWTKFRYWWVRHVQLSVRGTISLGDPPETSAPQGEVKIPRDSD